MHIMYVDESGDDGFSKTNSYAKGQTPTKYYIRTGLIIHDWKWKHISRAIDNFKYSKKIPKDVELHATEILNGRKRAYNSQGKRKSIPNWYGKNFPDRKDRYLLLEDICSLVQTLDLCIISVVIDKSKIITSVPNYEKIPKDKSWEMLFERYNLFLTNASDKIGIIISDAIEKNLEREHREFAKAIYSTSLHVEESHFVESILFEPSDSSNLLQLVDVVSFAVQRHYNVSEKNLFERIESKLFSNNSRVEGCGLKIWPE